MIRGLIGAVLGFVIAFVLDVMGADGYVLDWIQPFLTFEVGLVHFYGLFGVFGAVAGILPW